MVRTQNDVDYVGDRVVVEPIDVPLGTTYEQLLEMIYSVTDINKEHFRLILSCKYPMKKVNKFQPCLVKNDSGVARMLEMHNTFGMDEVELFVEQVPIDLQMNSPIGNCMPLLLGENDGTSNVQNSFTFKHRSEEDEEDEEGRRCDDDSVGAEDVHNDDNQNREGSSPFLAVHEAIEREQMRYVVVDGEGCNLSNNPDTKDLDDPIELSPMQYHLAPSPQFENVENIGHVVSSEWTPWGNTLMGHPIGEYKKAEWSQCPWRLRATVVKGTSLFEINKYSGPHTCVNPCMNQDHHQLDSNLIAAHIEEMIKTQFTLSVAAIQASVVERFGYHISYTKASKGKRKAGWFLACIRNRVTQRRGLCVIYDRHPGIMAAFANVYLGWSEPNAYHRICKRHLASNFMTHFKDKCLKQLLCRAALETKVEKFNMHMETIGRINQDVLNWLEAIPFEKWALSHDGGEQYTPYVDAKINANVVKAGSHEVVLYDHFQGLFHVKASRGSKKTSSGGRTHRVNLREHRCTCGKTFIYGFPCSHILAACHFRSIDFRSFVQHYYTIQSYFSTWAPLFNPIHNEYKWPPYVGLVIVPADSMKRVSGGRPKSTRLHDEMDVREDKTSVTCGLCKQSGHNCRSCPNKNMGVGPS
ncbi:hypothetical protein CK203_068655 [Vitis vinifera]|uniref:SWIM-type domain-containing protein n=1 Tax=Vitis vinifera TaxID=29760 RepID=A0A438EDZ5_VITVI|nr:hypothetical protein CK203_068655 [Vitis vinifera]